MIKINPINYKVNFSFSYKINPYKSILVIEQQAINGNKSWSDITNNIVQNDIFSYPARLNGLFAF